MTEVRDWTPQLGDPRTRVWSYVTDGRRLFEVIEAKNGIVTLLDCKTELVYPVVAINMGSFALVKAAPTEAPVPVVTPVVT